MPRPKTWRRVRCEPGYRYFKPQGVPLSSLDKRDLGSDELEAIRLADMLGLAQVEAASMMNISQPTFNRILASARHKAAECVVSGLAMRIVSPEKSNSVVDTSDALPARGRRMKERQFRFRCTSCDLQMILHERPQKCFCCGSTAIVREGWKQRFSRSSHREANSDRNVNK